MREVSKGICLIGEEFQTNEPTLVLMHPWYNGDPWSAPGEYRENDYRLFDRRQISREMVERGYAENMKAALQSHQGRIVVFEEAYKAPFLRAAGTAMAMSGAPGIYLISTDRKDSRPFISGVKPEDAEKDWSSVTEFLNGLGSAVRLAGGYLDFYRGEFAGCLGATYRELSQRGVAAEFVPGCCFTRHV